MCEIIKYEIWIINYRVIKDRFFIILMYYSTFILFENRDNEDGKKDIFQY